MMQQLVLALIGLVALGSADRGPRTLHERTCIGQWMPAVHLHGYCLIDVTDRSNSTEIDRLFETENARFDPVPLDKVPTLVMQRAIEEHALARIPRQLVANIDGTFVEPETGCSPGFYGYKGNCYTATRTAVSFSEAQHQCELIKGQLVTDHSHDIVGLLKYLVKHYIKADTYTGYDRADDLQNHVQEYDVRNTHVEVDYETGTLQRVVQGEERAFICVVPANVQTQALPSHTELPATIDDVISYDLNPPPPVKPTVERYLVDLLRFECPGNYTIKDVKQHDEFIHRADLVDLDEHMPYGCHFNKSLGNVIYDLDNPMIIPPEAREVCSNLVRLYRIYDHSTGTEYFGLHPPHRTYAFGSKEPRNVIVDVGYCSTKKDCGASIPLYNANSQKVVCYLFPSHRNLDVEIQEDRPLRFIQIAKRLVKIYNSKNIATNDVVVQLDPNPRHQHTQPELLGSVLSPTHYKELNHYCQKNLIPIYAIYDLEHKNFFLATSLHEVKGYRNERDHYILEELLGYGVNPQAQTYCGAFQALHHYRFINNVKHHKHDHHQDDAYYNVLQPVSDEVPHEIVAWLF